MNVPSDFKAFLEWLTNPLIIGAFASWLLLKWKKFNTWDSEAKEVTAFILVVALGELAYVANTYLPPEIVVIVSPFFKVAILTWLGAQAFFYWRKKQLPPDQLNVDFIEK